MIVYVYDSKTNEKLQTFKNVTTVCSMPDKFLVLLDGNSIFVEKDNVKLVVYGF